MSTAYSDNWSRPFTPERKCRNCGVPIYLLAYPIAGPGKKRNWGPFIPIPDLRLQAPVDDYGAGKVFISNLEEAQVLAPLQLGARKIPVVIPHRCYEDSPHLS